jgi:predicted transcriptional regulator YdeE
MIPTQTLEPKIVQLGALRLAGLRYEGKNQHGEIHALWDNQFLSRMDELKGIRVGDEAYGVARALPDTPSDASPDPSPDPSPGTFEYLAAVEVMSFDALPHGMAGWVIPPLTYAVLPAHDVPGIGPTCDYFYRQWLPQSKEYAMGEGLMIEVYPGTYSQDLVIYLYFPVKRK